MAWMPLPQQTNCPSKATRTSPQTLTKKDIEFDMTLIDKGDNRYEFKIGDRITFASPEVSGNKLIYYVGEGSDRIKMVFRRSK